MGHPDFNAAFPQQAGLLKLDVVLMQSYDDNFKKVTEPIGDGVYFNV